MALLCLLRWFVLLGPLWPLIQAVLGHNSPLGQLGLTFDLWEKKGIRRKRENVVIHVPELGQ